MDFHQIAVACPHCSHVAMYQRADQQRETQLHLTNAAAEIVMLRCGEPDCKGVLSVHVFGSEDWYKGGAASATFGNGVRCSNGHPVRLAPTVVPKRPRAS